MVVCHDSILYRRYPCFREDLQYGDRNLTIGILAGYSGVCRPTVQRQKICVSLLRTLYFDGIYYVACLLPWIRSYVVQAVHKLVQIELSRILLLMILINARDAPNPCATPWGGSILQYYRGTAGYCRWQSIGAILLMSLVMKPSKSEI